MSVETDTLLEARRPSGVGRVLGSLALSLSVAALGIGYSLWGPSLALEPYMLAGRFLGLAAAARAALGLGDAWPLLRLWLGRRSISLALSPEGLELRGWGAPRRIAWADVAAVVETSDDGVWLLLQAEPGPGALALPPVFERDEGALAERLMRRLDGQERRASKPESPLSLPSVRYDEAARGRPGPGALPLRHGLRWARRGPYAALLFAITLASSLLQAPGGFTIGPLFIGLLAVCLALPSLWLLSVRRAILPRRGLALLLTPEELLLRTRGGVVRAAYRSLTSARIAHRGSWSLLEGSRPQLTLVLEREDDLPIRFDASFFRWPPEVVRAAVDAYRRGALP